MLPATSVDFGGRCVTFTGGADAVCPISWLPLSKMQAPVAFRSTPQHAYECSAIVEWLQYRPVNPMTNTEVHWRYSALEILGPLGYGLCLDPTSAAAHIHITLGGDAMPTSLARNLLLGAYFLTLSLSILFSAPWWCHCLMIVASAGHSLCFLGGDGKLTVIVCTLVLVVGERKENAKNARNCCCCCSCYYGADLFEMNSAERVIYACVAGNQSAFDLWMFSMMMGMLKLCAHVLDWYGRALKARTTRER